MISYGDNICNCGSLPAIVVVIIVIVKVMAAMAGAMLVMVVCNINNDGNSCSYSSGSTVSNGGSYCSHDSCKANGNHVRIIAAVLAAMSIIVVGRIIISIIPGLAVW